MNPFISRLIQFSMNHLNIDFVIGVLSSCSFLYSQWLSIMKLVQYELAVTLYLSILLH